MSTTTKELHRTMELAHAAYESTRSVAPRERASWLKALADGLDAAAEELIPLAHNETHLTEGRLRGELQRSTFQIRLFAHEVMRGEFLGANIDHADEDWGMGPRPDIRRMNVPLGVVGVFGASNFPFAFSVMGGDTVSALASGCAVVHKVHEAHAELGERTAQIAIEALNLAGAPDGLFAAVSGRSAGEGLVDHPLTKAIGFTGSTRVGLLLQDRARSRREPIPFYGELGSINPVFVTRSAWDTRKDAIITGYVHSFTLGVGQFCTKPGLLFVPVLDEQTTAALSEAVREVSGAPMLTPRLAEGYHQAVRDITLRTGVETLETGCAGESPSPTLLTTDVETVLDNPAVLQQEMFGPASMVVEYKDESEMIEAAQRIEGQLTATVHADPGEGRSRLVDVLESHAGRVIWNSWPTGVSVTYAQQHGGPFPATTAPGTTSVGTAAPERFVRPVAYQDFPDSRLPVALQEANPWGIIRRVDGEWCGPSGDREVLN